jgi:hypothetical protein
VEWVDDFAAKLGLISDWPWRAKHKHELEKGPIVISEDSSEDVASVRYTDDAEFIAASPGMVSKLIAAVRVAQKAFEEVEFQLELESDGLCAEDALKAAKQALAQLNTGEFPQETTP